MFTFDWSALMTSPPPPRRPLWTAFELVHDSYPINVLHPKFQRSLSAVTHCKQDPSDSEVCISTISPLYFAAAK
jgi:hypothetical protein